MYPGDYKRKLWTLFETEPLGEDFSLLRLYDFFALLVIKVKPFSIVIRSTSFNKSQSEVITNVLVV